MTQQDTRKKITSLPSGYPTRGLIRDDVGNYIILAHPDRPVMLSEDGKMWKEANLRDPEHNRVVAMFERKRWAR